MNLLVHYLFRYEQTYNNMKWKEFKIYTLFISLLVNPVNVTLPFKLAIAKITPYFLL